MISIFIEKLFSLGFKRMPAQRSEYLFYKDPIKISLLPEGKESIDLYIYVIHSQCSKIYAWKAKSYPMRTSLTTLEALSDLKRLPLYIDNPIINNLSKDFMAFV